MINFKGTLFLIVISGSFIAHAQKKSIYHKGWTDLNKDGKKDIYEDPTKSVDERVKDLLSQMTVDEKTCQTTTLYGYGRVLQDELPTPEWKKAIWKDGIANIDEMLNTVARHEKTVTEYSFPYRKHADALNTIQKWFIEETRLGIPVDFTNEGIHGLTHDRATAFPAPIGIGCTWNKELVFQMGKIVGREAKALGYTNIYAPILDLARDPRWGRVVECYSEDPFLIAEMGKQVVLGIQGEGVASTLKHFAAYSVPKGGRDGNVRTDPHIAPRELHQMHLYPFRRVIEEAHPMGVMSSYNDWDGVPVTGSYYFLTGLLRDTYGFTGYVVSDSRAVEYLYTKHQVAPDMKDAVRQVVEAGLNVRTDFTMPEDFILPLRELVNEGAISMELLDSRVADVLRVKFRLGLFDQPYVADPADADKIVHTPANEAVAHQVNRESIVLLKNEGNLLPLDPSKKQKILVTGPLANETEFEVSRYGPANNQLTSVLQGIQQYEKKYPLEVIYSKGCDIVDENWPGSEIIPFPLTADEQTLIDEAVKQGEQSDVILAVMGEDELRVGESKSRTSLNLPGRQLQLLQALHKTGKPIILVLINGRPLTINWEDRFLPAIVEAWFPSSSGGTAIAEILFGDYNPGGKLSVTFPKAVGQIELSFPFKPGSHAVQRSKPGPNSWGNTAVNGPLYPFGYGLSYTTFEYSNLKVDIDGFHEKGQINVTVDVINSGARKGDEVVQLYFRDIVSSVTVYESQLRGFERVTLEPGETKSVNFTLQKEDLALLDKDMRAVVEPGEFEILIGSSSEDIRQRQTFFVK